MTKLLAVIRREYLQRVRTKMFIVATLLGPLMVVLFAVVPGLLFGIKAGDATRIAIVDESGNLSARVADAIMREDNRPPTTNTSGGNPIENSVNSNTQDRVRQGSAVVKGFYKVEQIPLGNRSLDEVKRELNERVRKNELDGYIVIPGDVLQSHEATYYARNTSDLITREQIASRVSSAVRAQRMTNANIDPGIVREMDTPVHLSAIPYNRPLAKVG